jgi:hypothetical protein
VRHRFVGRAIAIGAALLALALLLMNLPNTCNAAVRADGLSL